MLRETLAGLKRSWLGLIIWVLLCFAAALAYVLLARPQFVAITQVVLEPRQPAATLDPAALSNAPTLDSAQADSHVQVIQSERNLRYVFDTLSLADDPDFADSGFDLAGWVQSRLSFFLPGEPLALEAKAQRAREIAYRNFVSSVGVRRLGQSYVFEISFRALSPKKAARLANSVTAEYIRDQVEYNIATAAAQRGGDFLQNRIAGSKTELDVATDAVRAGEIPHYTFTHADARIVSAAFEPLTKSYPMTTMVLGISLVLGILTGVGAVILRASLDRTIRSREQVIRLAGTGAVTVLPRISRWRRRKARALLKEVVDAPASEFARTIRGLRTSVLADAADSGHVCVAVMSCGAWEGRSTVAANLARAISASGREAALLDTDLANPALSRSLSPAGAPGLSELIRDRGSDASGLELAVSPTLSFIPAGGVSGEHDPNLFIGSPETLAALIALSARRDVVIDLPPFSDSADVFALKRVLTGIVVIATLHKTTLDELAELLGKLRDNDIHVLRLLLNERNVK
jgi:polysaccharide biosynthesis transport protein